MFSRSFLTAFAALVIGLLFVDSVNAYPVTARSGVATVTGVYRPIDLQLSLVDGTDALDYCSLCYGGGTTSDFNYTAKYNGSYTGYGFTGLIAGNWTLSFTRFSTTGFTDDGNIITVAPSILTSPVGRLRYTGGGIYAGIPGVPDVPYEDTPQAGDSFDIYAASADPFLEVNCQGDTAVCSSFAVRLLQDLKLVGPYVYDGGEGSVLDDGTGCVYDSVSNICVPRPVSRVNEACFDQSGSVIPCGGIPANEFRASSSVPEPASLALVGLGIAGLALARLRRR